MACEWIGGSFRRKAFGLAVGATVALAAHAAIADEKANVDKACEKARNLVPNASFDLGTVGWHVLTKRERLADWTCADVATPWGQAPADGRGQALRVTVPADASVRITSEAMPLKPGATYAVSAWMRAETPGRTALGLAGPLPSDWWNGSTKGFAVSTNWTRFGGSITVPPNHHEAVFSVSWAKPGAVWLDEVMVRETTADESPASAVFAPRAAVEAGFALDDTYAAPGMRRVTFRAVDCGKGGLRTFRLRAEHPATGWRIEKPVTLDLKPGIAAEAAVELDLNRCGKLRLTADAPGTIPAALAILTPLDGPLPKLGDEFSVGVNETGVFPPHGSWAQRFCGIDGRDFAAHMALLRACGVQHVRVFNEDYGHFPVLSPSRGTFDATTLEPFLAALEKSGMPAYFTMKFSFSRLRDLSKWKHWSAAKRKDWYLFRESVPTGRDTPTRNRVEILPDAADVAAVCGALARACRGRVTWYELFNEPNLDLNDPKDCVRYQKAVCAAMKAADPACRLVGVCTTQDFGVNDADNFARGCLENGIAPYLDALSFHPYAAAMDNGRLSAAPFIRTFADLVKPYPHVGLWNTECFYLLNRQDYAAWRKKDPQFLRPQNLVRRTIIDLGEGLKVSTSLHVGQLFQPDFAEMTQFGGNISGHRLVPTDAAVALAAFGKALTGATCVRPLAKSLTEGMCGYLFRLADGRPAAALWAFEDIRRFVVETSAEVIDMYGNRLSGDGDRPRPDCGDRPPRNGDRPRAEGACPQGTTEYLIDERPLYVIGTGDTEAFFETLRIRPEKPVLVNGVRRIDAETVSVELLNLTDGDLTVRTTVADDTHDVVLTARERRAERFRVVGTGPGAGVGTGPARLNVTCRTARQEDVFSVRVEPTRKTARAGETVTVGPLSFSVDLTEAGVVVRAKTADATRTVGTYREPWTGDTIEFFLDANPDTHLDTAQGDAPGTFRLFVLPPTPDPAGAPGHRARMLATCTPKFDVRDITQRIDADEQGFGCQLTIPWSHFGGRRLDAIGFDVIADDFDPAGARPPQHHVWSGDAANHESRFKWGRIVR